MALVRSLPSEIPNELVGSLRALLRRSINHETGEAFLGELRELARGCVIVDVELEGMSGLELVRQMTDVGSSWPIIVISGSQDKKTENEALRLGARAYLRKPFDTQVLLNAIARGWRSGLTAIPRQFQT